MQVALELLTVLGLGVIELWGAVPVGFALGLPPLAIAVTSAAGAMLGAVAILLLGARVRGWLLQRHGGKKVEDPRSAVEDPRSAAERAERDEQAQPGLIQRIWQRYGVIGLGLLAPLLTGAPLGVALGLALGAPAHRLLFWICLGIVLWSAGLTLAGVLGLAGIAALER